ncbi:hypothetical protein ACFOGJ_18205 [Marinibaculum pumilum]|uniref:Extradiol ring-cleavage dioxygenase class III enzyme subunit B domain-containing protein n=1 Tax=Marinibaculum pumilum TaxID=1766165 RepID=A0ABV7L485_9PROT
MARITAAFGSSHSPMLNAELEEWSRFVELDRSRAFTDHDGRDCSYDQLLAAVPRDSGRHVAPAEMARRHRQSRTAMATLQGHIEDAKLDVLLIVGDDQMEMFQTDNMPAFGIFYGPSIRNRARQALPPGADPARDVQAWAKRLRGRYFEDADTDYPCHAALALHLIEGLIERGFDVSAIGRLREDQGEGHAFAFIHRRYLAGSGLPVVPVFLNTYFPPNQPTPRRCVEIGRALAALAESFPEDLRIGLLASGGLSHFYVDDDLDAGVMAALRNGDLDYLAGLDPRMLRYGSSEIRNWIAVAGALDGTSLSLRWMDYVPGYRTPAKTGTGLCFAAWM